MKFKIKWTEQCTEYFEAVIEANSEIEAIDKLADEGLQSGEMVYSECNEDCNGFDNGDYTIEVVE